MTRQHPDLSPRQEHDGTTDRQRVMRLAAGATTAELEQVVTTLGLAPRATDVRPPETGLVMIRGRIGGDGAPFNLGEATVTRAAIRLASGEMGQGHVLGRDKDKARLAAIIDAAIQSPILHDPVKEALHPIDRRLQADARRRASETAATRVDFFTLTRGDD